MKKSFKSKIDLVLLIPIIISFVAAGIFMIANGFVAGIITLTVLGIFIAYLYRETVYVVTRDNKLRIKSGFLYEREIYIKSIKKVRPTQDRSVSPALSLDRIEICYNRYDRIVVSPGNKAEFIKELKEVNPRIHVEENNSESFYQSVEKRFEKILSVK